MLGEDLRDRLLEKTPAKLRKRSVAEQCFMGTNELLLHMPQRQEGR